MPIYARIDVAKDNEGNVTLIEAEFFEPELFFRLNESAADEFAEAIRTNLVK